MKNLKITQSFFSRNYSKEHKEALKQIGETLFSSNSNNQLDNLEMILTEIVSDIIRIKNDIKRHNL